MRKNWKRWIAGLLTAVMLVTMLPTVAYAAVGDLLDMSGVQRTALLAALEEVYGDDAEAYLAILKQYGLIDEDGNIVTDEKIIMDGQAYTCLLYTSIRFRYMHSSYHYTYNTQVYQVFVKNRGNPKSALMWL